MIKTVLTFLLFTLACFSDEYPKPFAKLGTPLYKADEVFSRLSNLIKVNDKFTQYHIKVQKLLILASSIENSSTEDNEKKKRYVKGLRELQKEHDEIMRIINGYLLASIDKNDYAEFSRIMSKDIGAILENKIIKKRAMAYYVSHRTRGKLPSLDQYYQTLDSDPELMEYVNGHMPKVYQIETSYSSGGLSHKVLLSKNEEFAYVADGNYCFKTVDIKDFADASEASSFDFYGEGCELVDISPSSTGEYLYLSDEKNGFTILDLTQPSSPLQKGEYTRLRAIHASPSIDDNKIFIIRKTKGLSIFDISNKEEFKLLANYNRGLEINHLAIDDNRSRLYLSHTKGLSLLDISCIGNPREIFNFPLEDGANHVILSADKKIAYVASGENGIHVLDVSTESDISLISTCLTPKYAKALTLSHDGERLYVSALDDGVYYINTKDPKDLRHISTYKISDASALNSTLNRAENTLFISLGNAGIAKVKIQD